MARERKARREDAHYIRKIVSRCSRGGELEVHAHVDA